MRNYFLVISYLCIALSSGYCLTDSNSFELAKKLNGMDSTIKFLEQKIKTQDYFVSIVERTNQQLSQGMTFSSAFISALGVLFAIGSIIAGVLLFRQSKEYQKRIESAILGYDAVVNKFIEEKKVEVSMMIQSQELLKTSNTEHNLKIDKEIKQLSDFRDSLNALNRGSNLETQKKK